MMLGIPTREIKEAVEAFHTKVNRLDQIIDKTDDVLTNVKGITDDVRAITAALRAALVKEP